MSAPVKIRINSLSFSYKRHNVFRNITLDVAENAITAIVGPSGIGKSTFLMAINRLWENIPNTRLNGEIKIKINEKFRDIYDKDLSKTSLRRLVGMVFQSPNPLPMSIYKNVAFPLKLAGWKDKNLISERVQHALNMACLWDEVKNRLKENGLNLSGGQQQRLCIARALILQPEILLLDEPTSSLDAKTGAVIEDLLLNLKNKCTLLVVSHYIDQVKRIADRAVEFTDSGILSRKV